MVPYLGFEVRHVLLRVRGLQLEVTPVQPYGSFHGDVRHVDEFLGYDEASRSTKVLARQLTGAHMGAVWHGQHVPVQVAPTISSSCAAACDRAVADVMLHPETLAVDSSLLTV